MASRFRWVGRKRSLWLEMKFREGRRQRQRAASGLAGSATRPVCEHLRQAELGRLQTFAVGAQRRRWVGLSWSGSFA
eukprot:scaffold1960_cov332-Prasinococcus_capsulatus_cf.AAC.6